MQNKGAVKLLAILLTLICLFYLSFTVVARIHEKRADRWAHRPEVRELAERLSGGDEQRRRVVYDSLVVANKRYYLVDSIANRTIYNIGLRKYTYQEVKSREINLGLDLQGGMNVTLEVSVIDVVRAMSGYSEDSVFTEAIRLATQRQVGSQIDFVDLFYEAFIELDPQGQLASIFSFELKDRIAPNASNQEVMKVIRDEANSAISRSYNILRTRIDQFGVSQPNIQRLPQSGRILVELPGIKDPDRVRQLLQRTAMLEFWETWELKEVRTYLDLMNTRLRDVQFTTSEMLTAAQGTLSQDTGLLGGMEESGALMGDEEPASLFGETASDETGEGLLTSELAAGEDPLYRYLGLNIDPSTGREMDGPVVGRAAAKDTARINRLITEGYQRGILPQNVLLKWTSKPNKNLRFDTRETILELVALKDMTGRRIPPLDGNAISNASQDYDNNGEVVVSMSMNSQGARIWKTLTGQNIGKAIAIVLDGMVYSYPNVISEIPTGQSSISGNFSIEEAIDLANVLKAGKLPAPARIIEEAVVGPSLGKEAVSAGLLSFIIAFILVLIYMVVYYNKAGVIADIALLLNVFFLIGILASLQATLTLPGIAGIVLTLGMAVDANVITFERIREELRQGKGMRLAIHDGYRNALSAILDGNVTTFLTGVVLFVFGTGPVKGFATTLMIGIMTSLFSAVLISRLIFLSQLDKNKIITFGNKYTINAFSKIKFDFISKRVRFYYISGAIIFIGIVSLIFQGLNLGVDFSGGRTFIVRFDQNVRTTEISSSLAVPFTSAPEVKTFGPYSQVKISTKYMIAEAEITSTDSIIGHALYEGVKEFFINPISYEEFMTDRDDKLFGLMSSQMVGPSIAADIKIAAVQALLFALLIIFIYIALRFRKWQYGLGGVVAIFHDAMIAISMYSIFYRIMPFNMEVDQAFIAAILTIIGYSINDTVVIFDRIREFLGLHPKTELKTNINDALLSTLGRTINASGTTFVVLLAIFLFGGEVIRGFAFALLVGVVVGTYSSLFIASPIAYDFIQRQQRKKEARLAAKGLLRRKQ
jgi:SecD/SecF fusion protein